MCDLKSMLLFRNNDTQQCQNVYFSLQKNGTISQHDLNDSVQTHAFIVQYYKGMNVSVDSRFTEVGSQLTCLGGFSLIFVHFQDFKF